MHYLKTETGVDLMLTSECVKQMKIMSDSLMRIATLPKNYNTDQANDIEVTSFDLYKLANHLQDSIYKWGDMGDE